MPTEHVAAVVVGAGPAGAVAALTLARAGLSVWLLHRPARVPFQVGESLPPAATPLLADLGLLDTLAEDGHEPCYGTQSAWGGPLLRVTDFIHDPHGPGWRLDRPHFDGRLREAAGQAGAVLVAGEGVAQVGRDSDGWWGVAGQAVAARWAVDATGRAAALARRQGAQRRQADRLVGWVALFGAGDTEGEDTDSTTLVEAAPDGWWYTARLPDGRRVAVFHTDADLPAARQAATAAGYRRLLGETQHIQARLAAYGAQPLLGPYMAAANSARLVPPVGDGWLAVGDAALAFDPLSSQGLLTALYLGMQAGEALAAHLGGVPTALDRYAAQVDAVYAAYEGRRLDYYGDERRWAERPFWRRRHSQGVAQAFQPVRAV